MVRYIVTRPQAPVYSQPNVNSSIVTKFPQGLHVEGYPTGTWLHVKQGYVHFADLEKLRS